MKKCLMLLALFVVGTVAGMLRAQSQPVTGTVFDKNENEPLLGAGVAIKGTMRGTLTNVDGTYTLADVQPTDVLVFSYLGMISVEETAGNRPVINVYLSPDAANIGEVVVTAMGLERKSKRLTYATQQVGGSELTRAKESNMINSLQGKTSSLVITPNASGAGGSSKILLRGNKSVQGNNQPLIVIDGIPMSNPATSQQENEDGGRDGGDALSHLNPDDIASINILKGASAAALYGGMAANGVIMITTRKGRDGAVRIDFSSNSTMETLLCKPTLQDTYGVVVSGSQLNDKSWGGQLTQKASGADRLDAFVRTGANYFHAIALNGGSPYAQTYVSYANTSSFGILPSNDFQRHNMTVRHTLRLFGNRLSVDASINYITQRAHNRPYGGTYFNPLNGLYTFPANGDFRYYKIDLAKIIRVAGMHRIANTYSPAPYSQAMQGDQSVPYDSTAVMYDAFFRELEEAVDNLTAFVQTPEAALSPTWIASFDLLCEGSYEQWVCFANSLRLAFTQDQRNTNLQEVEKAGSRARTI